MRFWVSGDGLALPVGAGVRRAERTRSGSAAKAALSASAEGNEPREATDVALFGEDLWVSTPRGLHRFRISWKTWDDTFGGKEIKNASILRLERIPDFVGDTQTGETLYAVTEMGVFAYGDGFDTWERLGL